jgi:hypothetical protein
MPRGALRSDAPLAERICDGTCLAFALWTLCCHATVALAGTLTQLIAAYGLALCLAVAAWAGVRLRTRSEARAPLEPVDAPEPHPRRFRILQGAGLMLGAAAALAFAWHGDAVALWWSIALVLGAAAAAFLAAQRPVAAVGPSGRWPEVGLGALALACAVLTLVCHRPDIDDTFYVNVAVAAVDSPARALLSGDTLLGVEGLPLHMPAHRIHSYELWNGALAYLTGIPAIYCFHWLSASLVALLLPLAHAKLFRLLTPRVWLWGVAAVVVVLVAAGETHRWYGNFAFVRLWQGKGVLLFVFMPLVYAYGLRFGLRPTPRSWLLLAAAQIAAAGASSSAVWIAPAGALTALCCVLRPTRRGLRVFALGALASVYVLAIGWLLKGSLEGAFEPVLKAAVPGEELEAALDTVLGGGRLQLFAIASIPIAWACCARGLAQRFAIAFPLAVWLVLLSPYWVPWVGANLTGPSYWRSLWALPLPLLMALVLISPLHLDGSARRRAIGRLLCLLLLGAFAAAVPRFSALSQRNGGALGAGTRLARPGLKVPELPYKWAAALNGSVSPGARVVAPPAVNAWIPTFHHHAFPLEARAQYLKRRRSHLGDEEVEIRHWMTRYVEGSATEDAAASRFREGLERFDVRGVCLRNSGRAGEARSTLRAAGFQRRLQGLSYELWVRS